MKLIFSKKDKQKLHKQYRDSLLNVIFIINKFYPVISWHPAYSFQEIHICKRAEDKRKPFQYIGCKTFHMKGKGKNLQSIPKNKKNKKNFIEEKLSCLKKIGEDKYREWKNVVFDSSTSFE